MDSYSVLTSLIEAIKLLSADAFDALVADTIAEYRRHLTSEAEQKLRDGRRELGIIRKVDAIVDAIYYALDSVVRCRISPEVVADEEAGPLIEEDGRDFVSTRERSIELYREWYGLVEEFVNGAFGQEEAKDPQQQGKFMLTMVLSELLEFNDMSPTMSEIFLRSLRGKHLVGDDDRSSLWAGHMTNLAVTLIGFGLDHWEEFLTTAFREVHAANMRKGRAGPDGKVVFETKKIGDLVKIIKPAGWEPADLARALQDTLRD